jgi:hypothetical protein
MTLAVERLRQSHRGARLAEPASSSRLAALNSFGLRYVRVDDFNVIVEGDYQLNLAMSFWRANDGSAQGYLVSTLDAEIRRNRNSEKPVAGRESIVNPADSDKAAELTIDSGCDAESATGPSLTAGSASLLPVVTP